MANNEPEKYNTFWGDMGMILKGGIPEDMKNKDKLIELFVLKLLKVPTGVHWLNSKDEMVDGQDTIWYLSNMTSAEQIGSLPILEGFKNEIGSHALYRCCGRMGHNDIE